MKQEEDPLKELFDGFEPHIGDSDDFMSRLESRLDSVEMIRDRAADSRRRCILAAVIAAFVGFVFGVLITLSMPYIGLAVFTSATDATASGLWGFTFDPMAVISLVFTAALSLFIAVNAYSVTLSALKSRSK